MNNGDSPASPQNGAYSASDDFVGSFGLSGGGLTKREHFAGLAMQAILSDYKSVSALGNAGRPIAETALLHADALLRELSK